MYEVIRTKEDDMRHYFDEHRTLSAQLIKSVDPVVEELTRMLNLNLHSFSDGVLKLIKSQFMPGTGLVVILCTIKHIFLVKHEFVSAVDTFFTTPYRCNSDQIKTRCGILRSIVKRIFVALEGSNVTTPSSKN